LMNFVSGAIEPKGGTDRVAGIALRVARDKKKAKYAAAVKGDRRKCLTLGKCGQIGWEAKGSRSLQGTACFMVHPRRKKHA
jgi:hypothetical protein